MYFVAPRPSPQGTIFTSIQLFFSYVTHDALQDERQYLTVGQKMSLLRLYEIYSN